MIGKNIQALRKKKKMTQEALADQVGVARQTIVKWESGESIPDLDAAARLSSVLDVPLDELVNAPPEEVAGDPAVSGRHMFGLVTVGDKGQIVIPVRARRLFNINPGDQLMVLGDEDRGIALVDAQFFITVAEGIKNGK